MDLYRSMAGFRGDATLATWTYRVALNHCRKHAGRARPATVPYDEALGEREAEEHGPAHYAARRELSAQIHAALDALSPEQRDVVMLHELQELTYRECAADAASAGGNRQVPPVLRLPPPARDIERLRPPRRAPGGRPMTDHALFQDDLKAYADGELALAPPPRHPPDT